MSDITNGHTMVEIPCIQRYEGFEDVYIDQANQLTLKDLFSLHPTLGNGRISSSVIDSYLNILTKSCPGNICYIKSALATLIAKNQTPKTKPYDALTLAFVKRMAFPILLRSHWVLVVVDHHNKKVMKYDPAGSESCLGETERNIVVWYSNHKMSRFEKKLLRDATDDERDDFVDRSGTDGGIWILYEVWKIARDDIAVHERPSAYELRMRIFLELVHGTIFEESTLHPAQLKQAMRKLDRIVQSSVRCDLQALTMYSNGFGGDKEDQEIQTDDFIIQISISDYTRMKKVDALQC